MEGLNIHAELRNLYQRAKILTSTSLSLAALFAEEAERLKWEDEASHLRAVHRAVVAQLEQAKWNEDRVSYAYSQANLEFSLGGLVVGSIIKWHRKTRCYRLSQTIYSAILLMSSVPSVQ